MGFKEMKTAMFDCATSFFGDHVVFSEQKMAKQGAPLITLKFGNVRRKLHPVTNYIMESDDDLTMEFQMQADMEVNLFTQGRKIGGETYENTALSDLTDFVNYIESVNAIQRWSELDLTVQLMDGTLNDLSEIINETRFRYRARAVFRVYYVETTYGPWGQGGTTAPNASGGGNDQLSHAATDYFTSVDFEEDKK